VSLANFGVTQDGFQEKPFIEVLRGMKSRWRTFYPQSDDSDAAPDNQIFQTVAAELADRGLEFPTGSLWAALNEVYYSPYVLTATGASLDDVVAYRGLKRFPAESSRGTIIVTGAPGYIVPAGTIVRTEDDIEYVTLSTVSLPESGIEAIPIEAVLPGPQANRAPGTITLTNDANISVSNTLTEKVVRLGTTVTSWKTIPRDGTTGYYQLTQAGDLGFVANIQKVVLQVRNPSQSVKFFEMQVLAIDHVTGDIIDKSALQRFSLDALTSYEVGFTVSWNLLEHPMVRLVIVNHETSWNDIQVGIQEPPVYAQDYYENGVPQNATLVLTLNSSGGGATTGGALAEDDEHLRLRYLLSLFRPGSASIEALRSRLYRAKGVRGVNILSNPTLVTDEFGIPPKKAKIIIWGGDTDELAQLILQAAPVDMIDLVGNTVSTVMDAGGQSHTIRLQRPAEVPIYVEIRLKTKEGFPADGITQAKRLIVQAIGGFDDLNQEWRGGGLGANVYVSALESVVHKVPGVLSAEVKIGRSSTGLGRDNIEIAFDEVAQTHPALITFI
jgi:uncharacterized phage protein gp47/JayE